MPNDPTSMVDFKEWDPFLREVDQQLNELVVLHCLGGFVLRVLYDIPRPTGDLDYLEAIPSPSKKLLDKVAGEGSPLAKKYGMWIHSAGPTDMPEDYDSRLIEITGDLTHLKLFVPDAYDLLLSKLTANRPKDREDVKYVIQRERLSFEKMQERFGEMRSFMIGSRERHKTTLETWRDFFQSSSGGYETDGTLLNRK